MAHPRAQIRLISRTTAAGFAVAAATAALALSEHSTAGAGSSTRCCLKVTANVLGTIGADFGNEPRSAWQGRRDYSWSARETGLYEIEDVGGGWLFYDVYPREKIKGGASEVGTLTYNFRSPDPPDPSRGEPEVSNCEQAMSTGQKWRWSQGEPGQGVGESELLDVNAGGTELEVNIFRRIMEMDHDAVSPFGRTGECDHELLDHHEWFEVDGYPTTTYPEIQMPAPLRGRGLPSNEQLRKASPFESKKKEYRTGGHQPAGPISNSTHHTTSGTVKVKWVRFEYFPKSRLKQEIESFKKLE